MATYAGSIFVRPTSNRAANTSAKDRVKLQFILQQIAEKENIKVTEQEVLALAISS